MAPEDNFVSATVAVGPNGLLDASQPASEVVVGRAPLRWPYRSRAQQERAMRAAAAAAHSETSPELSNASEDDEKREDCRWETIKEDNMESGDSTSSSISRAQTAQLPDQNQVADEAECIQPIPTCYDLLSLPPLTLLACSLIRPSTTPRQHPALQQPATRAVHLHSPHPSTR